MVIGTIQTQDPSKGGDVVVKNGELVSGAVAMDVRLEIERRANYTAFDEGDKIYHINGKPLCKQLHPQRDFKGRLRPALISWDGENTKEILPTIEALGLDTERFVELKKDYDKQHGAKKLGKNDWLFIIGIGLVAAGCAYMALR